MVVVNRQNSCVVRINCNCGTQDNWWICTARMRAALYHTSASTWTIMAARRVAARGAERARVTSVALSASLGASVDGTIPRLRGGASRFASLHVY